jgi:macrodomain Ter protein organizer (MatP/YcbG family)
VSETPERIEREMSEIRSRMSSDINDLRKHLESQIVAEQVKQTIRQRLSEAADRGKTNLKAKQQDLAYSAKRSLSQARRKISNTRGE